LIGKKIILSDTILTSCLAWMQTNIMFSQRCVFILPLWILICKFFSFFFFSCFWGQAVLKLVILLPQSTEWWDYRLVPSHLTINFSL
jgi:hypothetical protein